MPLVFSRDEVREYLEDMGYGELSDEDLEKFIKDLRKLIKKDSRQRRRRRLGHTGLTRSELSTSAETSSARESSGVEDTSQSIESDAQPRLIRTPKSKQKRVKPRRVEIPSDFSTSHDTTSGTSMTATTTTTTTDESSTSGATSSKYSTPSSAEISDTLRQRDINRQVQEPDGNRAKQRRSPKLLERQRAEEQVSEQGDENVEIDGEECSSSEGTLSDTDLLYLMEHILKADLSEKTSSQAEAAKRKFEVPVKIRRDPVALYHWYKTFWDRQKAPGEDRHMQLRWNVRAGTIGRFPCDADGNPIQYLPQNPIKPRKKIHAF